MTHRRTIFLLFFLSKLLFVTAQGGSTIKATLDKNKILLGESLTLTVEAHHSPESVISFVSIDSIPHFEMLEKPQVDSVTQEGMTTIKGIYKLTSFDSGHWVIPSFVLNGGIKTDTLPVDVVFSDFDPSKDYHDIKDIIEVKPPKKKPWWWYAAGAAVLLAALLFYWLKRKKPVPAIAKPVQTANPYAEAMKQLDELKEEGLMQNSFIQNWLIFSGYIFSGRKGCCHFRKLLTTWYCS